MWVHYSFRNVPLSLCLDAYSHLRTLEIGLETFLQAKNIISYEKQGYRSTLTRLKLTNIKGIFKTKFMGWYILKVI